MYKITEYPNVVHAFRGACKQDKKMLAKLEDALQALREEGPACGMPTSKFLEDGIYELRPQTDKLKGRLLYYTEEEKTLIGEVISKAVIVYAFFKKTKKTPREAIDIAKRRRKELQQNKERPDGNGSSH